MDDSYTDYPKADNLTPEQYDIFNMIRERIRRDTVVPSANRNYGPPKTYDLPIYTNTNPSALPLTKYGDFSRVDAWTPDAITQFELRLRLNAAKYRETRRTWEQAYSIHWLFKQMFNDRPFFTDK